MKTKNGKAIPFWWWCVLLLWGTVAYIVVNLLRWLYTLFIEDV